MKGEYAKPSVKKVSSYPNEYFLVKFSLVEVEGDVVANGREENMLFDADEEEKANVWDRYSLDDSLEP